MAGAVASFRWTGSWYTVFVGVDPRDPDDLITEPGGRTPSGAGVWPAVYEHFSPVQTGGLRPGNPLRRVCAAGIAFEMCVEPDHFRGDVVEAVRQALSNRVNRTAPGLLPSRSFHVRTKGVSQPDLCRHRGGAGVLSPFVTIFRRFGKTDNGELASGVLPIGPWEIARLDNDPAFQENGVLRIRREVANES